jgi:hypothetical protein
MRVAPAGVHSGALSGGAGQGSIDTLRRRRIRRVIARTREACERRLGAILAKAFAGWPWRGESQGRRRRSLA